MHEFGALTMKNSPQPKLNLKKWNALALFVAHVLFGPHPCTWFRKAVVVGAHVETIEVSTTSQKMTATHFLIFKTSMQTFMGKQ